MSIEEWHTVLDKLKSQPISEAKLMGMGEPFFNPHYDVLCHIFRKAFPSAFVISATNCQYKLNDVFIKALPYIDLLYLSIDGYKETYEEARKNAKWNKLLRFLDDLSKMDRGKTRIAINYVVTNDNYQDIPKLHKLVEDKYGFIEEIRLNVAQWWNEDEQCQVVPNDKCMQMLKRYKSNVKGKAPWTYSDCFWPETGFYMDVYGDVRICCLNTSTKPVGNIFRDSLESLISSQKRVRILSNCKANIPDKHCKNCGYKRLSPILEKVLNEVSEKFHIL